VSFELSTEVSATIPFLLGRDVTLREFQKTGVPASVRTGHALFVATVGNHLQEFSP
jgi:hypothetical protein